MKRKLITISAVALVLALLLTLAPACGNGEEEPTPGVTPTPGRTPTPGVTPTPTGEVKTLKLGVIAPLSGPAAVWGIAMEQGAIWLADQVNDAGGLNIGGVTYMIDVISCDGGLSASESSTCANQLAFDEDVDWVLGPILEDVANVTIPLLQQEKILNVIIGGGLAPDRIYTYDGGLGGAGGKFWTLLFYDMLMRFHPEVESIVVIGPDTASGENFADVGPVVDRYGLEVLDKDFYAPGTTDFYPILTTMLAKNPDLLDMGGTPPGDAALILKQARELGFTGLIMAPSIGGSWPLMIDIAGAASAEGLIFNGSDYSSPVLPQGARDLFEDFIRRFDPEGGVMGYVAELGYVAVSFLVQGALAADSIDTEDIVAAIDADGFTFERFGFTAEPGGEETFNIRHQIPLVLAYAEIQDGQLVMLDADLLVIP